MEMLTRDQILAIQDLKTQKVDIPEWNGHVYVRAMTSTERDAWEASILSQNGKTPANLRSKLAAQLVCDESGATLFTEQDIEALGKKNAAALDRIFTAVMGLNKITDDDLDELAKN